MNIAVIGRANIGGGPADLWERAGHQVTRLGRAGGDGGVSETAGATCGDDEAQRTERFQFGHRSGDADRVRDARGSRSSPTAPTSEPAHG
ncbi:hypothetical protein [Streptomyces sp. 2A115]|uniref:hypothetical protein n=1 Tax=Streptomyces sp. 2A115 TaxID=3457439 RepID=UPI003FD03188